MEPSTVSSAEKSTDSGTHPGRRRLWERKQPQPSSVIDAISINDEVYINRRAVYKIKTYEKLAKQQKRLYRFFSMVALLGSATVPVLINFGERYQLGIIDNVLLTTAISLLVTIVVSIEKLYQFREHWRSYAAVAADLHYEQLQFQAKAGVYSEKALKKDTGVTAFQKFVIRFEGRINQEKSDRIDWETGQST